MSVAPNTLQANSRLGGLLSMIDETAPGAIEAVNVLGTKNVNAIDIDGEVDGVKAVCGGTMVVIVAQRSLLTGELSNQQVLGLAKGETIEIEQPVEVVVIDKSNCQDYLD